MQTVASAQLGSRLAARVMGAIAGAMLVLCLVPPASAAERTLTVKRGETLIGIAKRLNVDPAVLIRLNRLRKPYRLYIGQRLRLPGPRYHKVARGEHLGIISRRYNVSREALIRLNRLKRPDQLAVGQRLRLPDNAARTGRRAGSGPRKASRAAPAGGIGSAGRTRTTKIVDPPPLTGRGFRWPVRGTILKRFGQRRGGYRNDGINIATRRGTVVRVAENGVVIYSGSDIAGFGELILVKHQRGWVTAYAHNDRRLVRRGQIVRRGQAIARAGATGAVVRPQVHFQLRRGADPINPLPRLTRR